MTSRPPAGIQRQPQRSMSGTGILQRPTPQRTLSQQYSSSAPTRKSDNLVDLTADGSQLGRFGSSRPGGSRLKLELSQATKDVSFVMDSPKATEIESSLLSHRGRPKLQFEGDRPQLQGAHDLSTLSSIRGVENITPQTPMPLPTRPAHGVPSVVRGQLVAPTPSAKKDARPKPYVLEVPSAAPQYSSSGYADFFPWTGDHLEDQFTDHVIRQGFFDKSQTTQNETGSAKVSIFPAVKHKTGLQTLSSLFTSVLSQRRAHGQIKSTPTFKPPPRVTLTDTKRETWLRDLANPSISLRRLSRTIPHGIRGKALLEQCLSKNIPTARAVWLAKCVGANEIRAFKRKGITGTFAMGGETKWIRDWTIFVEQFIESIVAACGEDDWRTRVSYAVRLATYLYSEHLLDREHYMDWLSTSLESCPLAKAPIWILITQILWPELLKYRKYGRRLVAALCSHLQGAHESLDQDILQPLAERLAFLLNGLMDTHPESFISPKMWIKYKKLLNLYLPLNSPHMSITLESIDRRHEQLNPQSKQKNTSRRRRLIELLDKSLACPFPTGLSKECRHLEPDLFLLARTILDWSTSPHRPGPTKVFVATRLLRMWSRLGVDISDVVLEFLGSEDQSSRLCKPSLYHVVSELTRSGHFSVSRYLQWLIARGGVRATADLETDGPCTTRLLVELSVKELPDSMEKLRRTMLSRASASVDHELQEIQSHVAAIERYLPDPRGSIEAEPSGYNNLRNEPASVIRAGLSRATKSDMGAWIRKRVSLYMVSSAATSNSRWRDVTDSELRCAITSHEFNIVRGVLEEIEDFSMLADVLKTITHSVDLPVLAAVADTLNYHVETFAAIGALDDLFEKLLMRLRSLPEDGDTTVLLSSLARLAGRLPGAESLALQLSQEIIQNHNKSAADACSPVSDHMSEVLDDSEPQFADEMDKILVRGNSMDQATLERLFERIMIRIEASWTKHASQVRTCALLLVRLKCFGIKQFEFLMAVWLRKLLLSRTRPPLVDVLGPLISVDCLDLREVITICTDFLENSMQGESFTPSRVADETLKLLLGTSYDANLMTSDDFYNLGIRRLRMHCDYPRETLSVIRRAIECSTSLENEELFSVSSGCSERIRDVLRHMVLRDLGIVVEGLVAPLAKSSCMKARVQLSKLVQHLLEYDDVKQAEIQTVVYRVEHTLRLADDLTLPFCQLELQSIFADHVFDWSGEDCDSTEYLEAFERAVDFAVENNNRSWTSIIPLLDIQIARHLCQRAESLLLQLFPPPRPEDSGSPETLENYNVAKRLLFIIDATAYSMQGNRTPYLAPQIVEKLNDIWQISSQGSPHSQNVVIEQWLPLMLDFVTLHIGLFDCGKNSSELRSRILLALSSLLLELQIHPNANVLLLQQIFDVGILLVDDLPEDARLNCARSLKDKVSDPGIQYIFGFSASSVDWLQLSQKGKVVSYPLRRWEILSEPTPNVGENDTSLSLTLFGARKI